jgi:hypothetical protein
MSNYEKIWEQWFLTLLNITEWFRRDAMRVRRPRHGRLLGGGSLAATCDVPHPHGRFSILRNHVNGEKNVI